MISAEPLANATIRFEDNCSSLVIEIASATPISMLELCDCAHPLRVARVIEATIILEKTPLLRIL